MAKTYLCRNKACSLGTPGQPGRFTGGITKEQLTLMTGTPAEHIKKGEFGPGVCPNCGQPGEEER